MPSTKTRPEKRKICWISIQLHLQSDCSFATQIWGSPPDFSEEMSCRHGKSNQIPRCSGLKSEASGPIHLKRLEAPNKGLPGAYVRTIYVWYFGWTNQKEATCQSPVGSSWASGWASGGASGWVAGFWMGKGRLWDHWLRFWRFYNH